MGSAVSTETLSMLRKRNSTCWQIFPNDPFHSVAGSCDNVHKSPYGMMFKKEGTRARTLLVGF